MSSELIFREISGMKLSISAYFYEALVDYREGIEVSSKGYATIKSEHEFSNGRMILVEIAFIPLIVLSSIETVVRGVLAAPLYLGLGICGRKENESIRTGILKELKMYFIMECLQLATLTASVKGLYRNIFTDELPSIDGECSVFIGKELSCGFAPNWVKDLL